MSQRDLNYRTCIHFYILFDLDLNEHHLRLYGQIEQMESHPNPACQPTFSYQWIADQLGIKRRYAIDVANKLKEKGYIERVENGKDSNNQTIYLWRTKRTALSLVETPGVQSHNTRGVQPECTPGVQSECTQNTSKLNSSKKQLCALSRTSESFEEFWTLYPTKKAKKKCLDIWKRRKLDGISETIIEALKRQIENDGQWRNGFIPNPSTYLNQDRWEDEISVSQEDLHKKQRIQKQLDGAKQQAEIERISQLRAERESQEYHNKNIDGRNFRAIKQAVLRGDKSPPQLQELMGMLKGNDYAKSKT